MGTKVCGTSRDVGSKSSLGKGISLVILMFKLFKLSRYLFSAGDAPSSDEAEVPSNLGALIGWFPDRPSLLAGV